MQKRNLNEYLDEKFNGLFRLANDGDHADVVFLYTSDNDMVVGDVHYIKSYDYTGYVSCVGKGCPVCGKGIRVQSKLPVPVYNVTENEIQVWDRNIGFRTTMYNEVFKNYPNPSDYVFSITRHGVAGDINTTYEIKVAGVSNKYNIDDILAMNNTNMDEIYNRFCKDYTKAELKNLLNTPSTDDGDDLADGKDGFIPFNYELSKRSNPVTTGSEDLSYKPVQNDFMNIPDESSEETLF